MFHTHTLHQGSLFSVHDVDCRAPASGCGSDEHATSHHMVFVRNGVFVKHVGKQEIVADASRVLFFNRDEPYRVSHPVDGGDACTVVKCSPSAWREILARHDEAAADAPHSLFTMTHAMQSSRAAVGYRRLRSALRRGAVDALEVEETTLGLIDDVLIGAHGRRTANTRSMRRATRHARRDLAEHTALVLAARPAQRHSLGQLARAVNSSPFHLARVFREETGTSIHQHLLKLRLSLALDRVLDRPDNLSEVAHSLGFSSHAHLTTLFRREFGATPSALRGAQ
ncbi:MAG TPA: AraC family transcriptional regulator [Gemmatimonadaceae bacterium]